MDTKEFGHRLISSFYLKTSLSNLKASLTCNNPIKQPAKILLYACNLIITQ